MGEACRGLSAGFRASHEDEIWSDAAGFRNVLVHQYFGIDLDTVWEVVVRELPGLKRKALEIIATYEQSS